MQITKNILNIAIAVSLLITIVSCSNIKEIKIGDIRDVNIINLNNNILTLKVVVPVENPNSFNVKIKGADLRVIMGDKEIGKVKQIDDLMIYGKSTKEYPVMIMIELTDVNSIMASAYQIFSGEMHDVRLSGTVVVKSFMYRRTIRVENFPLVK